MLSSSSELLEVILLHADVLDILRWQQVSARSLRYRDQTILNCVWMRVTRTPSRLGNSSARLQSQLSVVPLAHKIASMTHAVLKAINHRLPRRLQVPRTIQRKPGTKQDPQSWEGMPDPKFSKIHFLVGTRSAKFGRNSRDFSTSRGVQNRNFCRDADQASPLIVRGPSFPDVLGSSHMPQPICIGDLVAGVIVGAGLERSVD